MSSPYPPPQGGGGSYQQGGYGQPAGYGAPPPQQHGYGQAPNQGYGNPQQNFGGGGGYQQGGYQQGGPAQQNYGGGNQGYGQQGGGYQQQQQGGYGAPQQQGQDQLRQWFSSVDVDRSGAISQTELKQALVNGDWTPFSDNAVRMLMNLFDTDRSGTIGFNEFAGLWQYIKDWQGVFRNFDRDRSGTIDGRELSAALSQFGFNLPPNTIQSLERKYNGPPGKPGAPGPQGQSRGITFDAFVQVCVTVRSLTESFRKADVQGSGYAQLSYTQFLDIVIAAP